MYVPSAERSLELNSYPKPLFCALVQRELSELLRWVLSTLNDPFSWCQTGSGSGSRSKKDRPQMEVGASALAEFLDTEAIIPLRLGRT